MVAGTVGGIVGGMVGGCAIGGTEPVCGSFCMVDHLYLSTGRKPASFGAPLLHYAHFTGACAYCVTVSSLGSGPVCSGGCEVSPGAGGTTGCEGASGALGTPGYAGYEGAGYAGGTGYDADGYPANGTLGTPG